MIVDTVPPKTQLTARRGDAGQITAFFRIEELYPKLDTLAIEYRLSPTAAWQTVPVGPKDVRSNNAEHTGEVTWYPQMQWGPWRFASASATWPAILRKVMRKFCRRLSGAAAPANPVRPPTGAVTAIPAGTNPLGPRPPISPANNCCCTDAAEGVTYARPGSNDSLARSHRQGGRSVAAAWPADGQDALAGRERRRGLRAGIRRSRRRRRTMRATARWLSVSIHRTRSNSSTTNRQHRQQAPTNPLRGSPPVARPGRRRIRRPRATSARRRACNFAGSNTRAFQLNYDIRTMGGVANVPVELWGTRDGGKSWQSFGRDPKGQSPMLVTVPEDGIYGFRMAMQNGPGMAGRPPLPGEVPGIWIGIDLTRPLGRITRAQQGAGPDGGKLFIEWEASDNRELAAKPISLSYSERLGGPWTTMASDLENTGRYVWQLTGSLPQRMYLRLEIHDAAGNMGIYETPEPVTLDLSSPAAQLRDLRPLGRLDSRRLSRHICDKANDESFCVCYNWDVAA